MWHIEPLWRFSALNAHVCPGSQRDEIARASFIIFDLLRDQPSSAGAHSGSLVKHHILHMLITRDNVSLKTNAQFS